MGENKWQVLVLDMQPIDPPIGGGRLRLLGLYHNLGENFSTKYIGSYDWPGEKYRDHQLSDSLREVDIPLSDEHFAECRKWQGRVGGKTIIDTTFSQLAHLSPQYVNYVRSEVVKADAVIFSHPWVYPLVKDLLNKATQIVIYDSQNVEGYLRYTLLDDNGLGTEIVRNVVKTEYELCHFVDVVFTCSFEDCELFNKLYAIPFSKMKMVPNGVFTEKIKPVHIDEKKSIKKQLGLADRKAAIFIGSNYPPNVEASLFIIKELAPILPEMTFIIAGGVGEGIPPNNYYGLSNIRITGGISDNERLLYLAASDLAINPMFSGSGTNIKMFDYMAAELPIVSTNIGARGITEIDYAGILIGNKNNFKLTIINLIIDDKRITYLGKANRELVEKNYSWEKISPKVGVLIENRINKKKNKINEPILIKTNKKFALMSSWNLRCGIAEHTRNLVKEFEVKNDDFLIISNSNIDHTNSNFIDDISRNIYPLWKYDYLKWKDTKIDIPVIIKTLQQEKISKLNVQYHTGFFNQEKLLELLRVCKKAEIELSITLHNSKEMDVDTLLEISKLGIKQIVHSIQEMTYINSLGIYNVFNIPLGVLDFPDEEKQDCRTKLGISGNPVISSFGFLRPHKGVIEALEAVSILRDKYPNIKFLGINSLYPSEDSEQYHRKCVKFINDLSLDKNIILMTSFLEMEQVINFLHASDIIVLPYHDSKEGSSAAANTAISAKRPLIISTSSIFNTIAPVCYILNNIDPPVIASEIQKLISAPDILNGLKNKVVSYANDNSYKIIAEKYLELIFGVN